jgi:hypothetical protein
MRAAFKRAADETTGIERLTKRATGDNSLWPFSLNLPQQGADADERQVADGDDDGQLD